MHRLKFREVLRTIRQCDGLVSGGGSLMQDVTGMTTIPYYLGILKLAQWLRKPTFVYAQGIGPVKRPIFQKLLRRVFRKCRYISVRDQDSAGLLQQIGLPDERIEVVPDPVMGLPLQLAMAPLNSAGVPSALLTPTAMTPTPMQTPAATLTPIAATAPTPAVSPAAAPMPTGPRTALAAKAASTGAKAGGKPVIGVAVRYWSPNRVELDMLANCLYIIQSLREVTIRFLPFHPPMDRQASQEVIDGIRRRQLKNPNSGFSVSLVDDLEHPQQMLAAVADCDLLIGMRLHALIYAASQMVPVVGITYDPKIDHFLEQLGLEAAASTTHFNPHKVADEALEILEDKQWMEGKRPLIELLKAQAARPAQQIISYLATI